MPNPKTDPPLLLYPTVDELVGTHGKEYRQLIEDTLAFLDEKERAWGFKFSIDRYAYVRLLVKRVKWATLEAEAKKA